ncbi:hypothetical protein ADICYQ_3867 [Cyclobacterium qasimii M12-11B]|uniref:Uncharacterized protein n=1 Tax=Cyclobacterium qasimii M12-11B TaxID=641524 RepID=S7VBP8_9BACT|nr:hypothetical protein ADICYQ_3867 [Cyclobacterium qasimii M12-11B]
MASILIENKIYYLGLPIISQIKTKMNHEKAATIYYFIDRIN